jgi:hypothetical protein
MRAEDQALLRRLSVLLVELARESELLNDSPESPTMQEMRAAAADLRHLAAALDLVVN